MARDAAASGLSDNLSDGYAEDDRKDDKRTSEEVTRDNNRNGWMFRARQVISESKNHWETAYRTQWAKSQANFQNRHPPGSKYEDKSYKFRSKSFRPKTRSVVRRNEAAAATAYFSTSDPVAVEAQNKADPAQVASAKVWQSVLKYRLKHTIKWFQTVIGAYQDTHVMGACFSHQHWAYEEDYDGNIIKNGLAIDPIAPENLRFHPDCDWRDPIGTSPYIVHVMPMIADQVKLKMDRGDWIRHPDGSILAASKDYDNTEAARDPKTATLKNSNTITGFETIWVVRVIWRENGRDMYFYTLGEVGLLTEPAPLAEATVDGQRDYSMGVCNIEAHKPMPAAPVEMYQDLQALANTQMNQRIDNVNLAMNGRYLTRRDAVIDMNALRTSKPGGTVDVSDVDSVKPLETRDVTSNAYKEQDYLNADFDDLAGTMSQSTVNTNRRMGETVGGMELLAGDSNIMTEYQLRIFTETWMKETLSQCLKLCQKFENDQTLMVLAANENMEELLKYGVNEITDEILNQDLACEVAVGIDRTNPEKRVGKIMMGANLQSQMGVPLAGAEIMKEVWGTLGFGSGERFVNQEPPPPSPEAQAAEADMQLKQLELQMKQMEMQGKQADGQVRQAEGQSKIQIAQMDLQKAQLALEQAQIQAQGQAGQLQGQQEDRNHKQVELRAKLEEQASKQELEMAKLQQSEVLSLEDLKVRLEIAAAQNQTQRDIAALNAQEHDDDREQQMTLEELRMKAQAIEADKNRKSAEKQSQEKATQEKSEA